jgi:hypothetical protein
MEAIIKEATQKFEKLVREQLARAQAIKEQGDFIDYSKLDKIIIGVCGGDGIGPIITKESARVLEYMLSDLVEAGKVEAGLKDVQAGLIACDGVMPSFGGGFRAGTQAPAKPEPMKAAFEMFKITSTGL